MVMTHDHPNHENVVVVVAVAIGARVMSSGIVMVAMVVLVVVADVILVILATSTDSSRRGSLVRVPAVVAAVECRHCKFE